MKYDYIIWDFNGTLYNDVEASYESTNILLENRHLPVVKDISELREHFCFPVKSYYKELGFDYTVENYEDIALEWLSLYNERSKVSKLNDGVKEVLEFVKKNRIKQIIISACEKNLLVTKLNDLGIIDYFDMICGTDNANAESKSNLAKEWRNNNKSGKKLMIGDTVHDFEVANGMGADCILFSGGFQSDNVLEKCRCHIINKMEEIIEYIL